MGQNRARGEHPGERRELTWVAMRHASSEKERGRQSRARPISARVNTCSGSASRSITEKWWSPGLSRTRASWPRDTHLRQKDSACARYPDVSSAPAAITSRTAGSSGGLHAGLASRTSSPSVESHVEITLMPAVRLHVVGAADKQRATDRRPWQAVPREVVRQRHAAKLGTGRMAADSQAGGIAAMLRGIADRPGNGLRGFLHHPAQRNVRMQIIADQDRKNSGGDKRPGDEREMLLGLIAPGAAVPEQNDRGVRSRARKDVERLPWTGAVAHVTDRSQALPRRFAPLPIARDEILSIGNGRPHIEVMPDLRRRHVSPAFHLANGRSRQAPSRSRG